MGSKIDMIGRKCGRWLVVSRYDISKTKEAMWNCVCECGTERPVTGTGLRSGRSSSCGCLHKELISKLFTKHGMYGTKIYKVWGEMIQRCTNKNNNAYDHYGNRGIQVCDRWRYDFSKFYEDMGGEYRNGLTLDRIDNNYGYCKSNCRWVDMKTQGNNRRDNVFIDTPDGVMTQAQASRFYGIDEHTISYRLKTGKPIEQILSKEPLYGKK